MTTKAAALKKDPYGLSRRKGGDAAPLAQTAKMTEIEVRSQLKGYIRIPPELYGILPMNIHVKYLKAVPDAKGPHHLYSGFMVKSRLVVQYRKVGPKRMGFLLKSGFKKPIVTWMIEHSKVGFLYAKAPATSVALHREMLKVTRAIVKNVKTLASHLKKVDSTLKKMEKRIQALEKKRR